MFFRLPRHPLMVVALTVLVLLAVLERLFVHSPPVPPEYVGSWVSGPTRLDINPNGIVQYRTGDGVVSKSIGGHLTHLGPDVLTYRTLLIPTHLRIDVPPHRRDDDQWLMTVEGQVLWRIP